MTGSGKCVDLLLATTPPLLLTRAMLLSGPPIGTADATTQLVARGADVNATDPQGRTMLMLAAATDVLQVDVIKTLIARGADVNRTTAAGETALGFAKQRGRTAVVDRPRAPVLTHERDLGMGETHTTRQPM